MQSLCDLVWKETHCYKKSNSCTEIFAQWCLRSSKNAWAFTDVSRCRSSALLTSLQLQCSLRQTFIVIWYSVVFSPWISTLCLVNYDHCFLVVFNQHFLPSKHDMKVICVFQLFRMAECWFWWPGGIPDSKWRFNLIERPWSCIRFLQAFSVYIQPFWRYERFFNCRKRHYANSTAGSRSKPKWRHHWFDSLTRILYRSALKVFVNLLPLKSYAIFLFRLDFPMGSLKFRGFRDNYLGMLFPRIETPKRHMTASFEPSSTMIGGVVWCGRSPNQRNWLGKLKSSVSHVVTCVPSGPYWTDFCQTLHFQRYCWLNKCVKVSCWLVRGFKSNKGSKITCSHGKVLSSSMLGLLCGVIWKISRPLLRSHFGSDP